MDGTFLENSPVALAAHMGDGSWESAAFTHGLVSRLPASKSAAIPLSIFRLLHVCIAVHKNTGSDGRAVTSTRSGIRAHIDPDCSRVSCYSLLYLPDQPTASPSLARFFPLRISIESVGNSAGPDVRRLADGFDLARSNRCHSGRPRRGRILDSQRCNQDVRRSAAGGRQSGAVSRADGFLHYCRPVDIIASARMEWDVARQAFKGRAGPLSIRQDYPIAFMESNTNAWGYRVVLCVWQQEAGNSGAHFWQTLARKLSNCASILGTRTSKLTSLSTTF